MVTSCFVYVCCNNLKNRLKNLKSGKFAPRPEYTEDLVSVHTKVEQFERFFATEYDHGDISHLGLACLLQQIMRNQLRASRTDDVKKIITEPIPFADIEVRPHFTGLTMRVNERRRDGPT